MDLREAFRHRPYRLPSKYLYDETGSLLYQEFQNASRHTYQIDEWQLFERFMPDLRPLLEVPTIVELGAGCCRTFERLATSGLVALPQEYIPIDISSEPLLTQARRIAMQFPPMRVTARIEDFDRSDFLSSQRPEHAITVLWFGNAVANLESGELRRLLATLAAWGPTTSLILGLDLSISAEAFRGRYTSEQKPSMTFAGTRSTV